MPSKPGFIEAFRAALVGAVQDVAEDSVQNIKNRLSTPYPPASQQGEAPHRRTGKLREGVKIEGVTTGSGRVEATIISGRAGTPQVPAILEDVLHRPYMSTEELYLKKMAAQLIAAKLKARFS